ncbi:alpha/beta hydrolase family protein [Saccharibacillus alkalitolerans]|uniref:Dienelactone hydrolase n=1 Tax=Saccharibacillus alkalitolerans TaxID=2705290 RepID=A0ABX0FA59_9BACL|nr:dienelactone hydrolase [Saccharibacillus alkalitolerans]NGZ76924.1 dienelactone hydrolase [Saccharibacillus alkalitolerans]
MRPFELLLCVSTVLLLASIVPARKGRRFIPPSAAGAAAGLFLVLHGTLEGFRVQLLFPYCVTILFGAVSGYRLFKKTEAKKMPRFLTGSAYAAAAVLMTATAGLLYAFPVFKLPEPTGGFRVGTQTFHLADQAREETFDRTAGSPRELMVQVWYPAEGESGRPLRFIPDTRILPDMAADYGLPGFTFQHLKYISGHAHSGAIVSSAQDAYPLILANPGFGSSRFMHTSQAEDLASHGYIVAVIDHTYNTFATEFPDGRITRNASSGLFSPEHDYRTERENRDKLGGILTDDVTFVLDQFERIQSGRIPSSLKGKIDLGHVGTFGHSIGGATAYDAAYDPRIAAGIDLDGGLYRLRDRERLRKPFLFIHSESEFQRLQRVADNRVYTDDELKRMGSTREWEDQVAEDKKLELKRMREAVEEGGQVLHIEDTEHLNFTDVQFISPVFRMLGVTGKIAPRRANAVINGCMLDFFDKHLKKQTEHSSARPEGLFLPRSAAAGLSANLLF